MANVAFITLYDKGCLGIRYISSLLKREGHRSCVVYLGRHEGKIKNKKDSFTRDDNLWVGVNEYGADLIRSYSDPIGDKDTDVLLELLKRQKPDVIGFSLRTMFLDTAIHLTEHIRNLLNTPIIYGGIAATSEPDRCIRYADMVCIGEGEYSMLELARRIDAGRALDDIANIWLRQGENVYRNTVAPLEQDLDKFPFPDYDGKGKFSINSSMLVENDDSLGNMSRFTYEIITSRGCPFSCSYCCNDLLKRLYAGQRFVRRRSVKDVIEELKKAKAKYNIKSVLFKDEIFTFDLGWIKEFADMYKKEVGLGFWCYTHPLFADKEILGLLKGCGMFNITMGIQSGSENILYNAFNRRTPRGKIIEAALILEKLKLPLRPRFDIITNNPFENEDDRRLTLEVLMSLPKPVDFGLTKLSFIPSAKINELLKEKGLDKMVDEKVYRFWNYLYLLNQYTFFPNFIIRGLSRSAYLRRYPVLLVPLLTPKFLEIKFREFSEKLKGNLPASLVLFLKRIRYLVKGY